MFPRTHFQAMGFQVMMMMVCAVQVSEICGDLRDRDRGWDWRRVKCFNDGSRVESEILWNE